MNQNKTGRYLKYAIGEIILVVVGILIALSINDWNTQRLNRIKEKHILIEIKDNLDEDLQDIERILNENTIKIKSIDTAFYHLSVMSKNKDMGRELSSLFPILTNYNLFNPTRVAFDNMISSGNIDILESDNLRKEISKYYSSDDLDVIQNQLIVTTQGFLSEVAPKMVNKAMMKSITNLDFDISSLADIKVYKDPYVISDLFVMQNKTRHHNKILTSNKKEIDKLVKSIVTYIGDM